MLLLKKKEGKRSEDSDKFTYTTDYIFKELELIQPQQENIIRISEELETALGQTDKIKEILQMLKKVDKIILEKEIGERRKQDARMTNLMEDIKSLIRQQRYEDIEKIVHQVHTGSQTKLKLSQDEMKDLKDIMTRLEELYKQSVGLCRLYVIIHSHAKQIYQQCSQEFGIETAEEVELSGAGAYTQRLH